MNAEHARKLIARLRRLSDAQKAGRPAVLPDGSVSRLDLIERQLLEAIRRDDTGSTVRDGFGSGKPGSGGDDAGTSTETAALSNLEHPTRDEHHARTVAAFQHLELAAEAVAALVKSLDEIDRRANPPKHSNPSGVCAACLREVACTANDRLRSGYCFADYQAWVRAGRPDRAEFERQRRQVAA